MMSPLRLITAGVRALLDGRDAFGAAHAGAHGSATSPWNALPKPTKAQEKAGNYPLGTVAWQGLTLKIENPAYTVREGVDPDGTPWRNVMKAHYGYFAGTRGADGDGVDVFLGPFPESDRVWVLNQRDARGAFDEHKVLAGFHDETAAVDAYRLSYTPGWDRYGPPIPLSLTQLRWWLQFADLTRELTLDLVPPEPEDMNDDTNTPAAAPTLSRVFWDSAAEPTSGKTLADVLYTIRASDAADGLVMDAMTMRDITEGAELIVLDALVTVAGKLKPKMEVLQRVMEAAGGDVKPLSLQLSEPMRRYGGVHVAALFELSDGQTITIWFHNPDSTPAKLTPMDDLVSWKWQLNKKDITIVVAPESGQDLNLREVARRIMRLATKNSAAFAKSNSKRAAVMAEIDGLRTTLGERKATLQGLMGQIEVAKMDAEDRTTAEASRFLVFRDGGGAVNKPMAFYANREDAQEVIDDSDTDRAGAVYGVDTASRDLIWSFRAETFIKGATEKFDDAAELNRVMEAAIRWANKERGEFGVDWIINNMPAWVSLGWRIDRATAMQAVYFHMGVGDVDEASLYVAPAKPEPAAVDLAKVTEAAKYLKDVVYSLSNLGLSDKAQIALSSPLGKSGRDTLLMGAFGVTREVAHDINNRLDGRVSKKLRAVDMEDALTTFPDLKRMIDEARAEYPAPSDVAPEPVAPTKTAADLGLEDASPEAVELLDGNVKPLATVKKIASLVKTMGGAVSWVSTDREPEAPVFDGLFELDGARFVRGDITYKSKPLGAVTVNGTGQAFFTKPDGSAFIPGVYEGDGSDVQEEAKQNAIEEGFVGWTTFIPDVVSEMLSAQMTDPIDEEEASKVNQAENKAGDNEQDGMPVPNTILDKGSEHWKRTLSDLSGKSKTANLGTLRNGARELKVQVVRRMTNRADWYITISQPGATKAKENIPFPSLKGNTKALEVASILMGYLDADEASGFKIAPPGSMEGAEPETPAIDALRDKIVGQFVAAVLPAMLANWSRVEGNPTIVADAFSRWWEKEARSFAGEAGLSELMAAKQSADAVAYVAVEIAVQAEIKSQGEKQAAEDEERRAAFAEGIRKANEAQAAQDALIAAERAAEAAAATAARTKLQLQNALDYLGTLRTEIVMSKDVTRQRRLQYEEREQEERIRGMGGEPGPSAMTESAEAKFLREVGAGVHDALDLGDMLAKIEVSVAAMQAAGQLAGDNDPVADAAILRWASLEEKANG